MEDNTYFTDKLYQKLYQLNVIHDMDHDFSTTKFADRLGKIGKRIHNTAIALGVYPPRQGQGGGDGDSDAPSFIQDNQLKNETFVNLFNNATMVPTVTTTTTTTTEEVPEEKERQRRRVANEPTTNTTSHSTSSIKFTEQVWEEEVAEKVRKHLDNLISSHEQYTDDIFNKGVSGLRKSVDNYEEGDILLQNIKLNDLIPTGGRYNTRSKILDYSKYIINCNDFISFHILSNMDLYGKIKYEQQAQEGQGGGDATLVAQRPSDTQSILGTPQSQDQGAKMNQQMFDQLRKANEQRQKEMEERKKVERYKKRVKDNIISLSDAQAKMQSEGLNPKLLDDTDSESDSDSDSESESNSDVASGKTKPQEKTTTSIADDKIEFSAQKLSLKEKKLISVTNVLNYNIRKTKGINKLKLLNEYYRMQLNIIITLSAIGYTDDVFSLISSSEYRRISFLSVLYLFYSEDGSASGFEEVLNGIYINPNIESTNDNMKGGNGPELTVPQLEAISKRWLGIDMTIQDGQIVENVLNTEQPYLIFEDDKIGEISQKYKAIPWDNTIAPTQEGQVQRENWELKAEYVKWKCNGPMSDVIAILQDLTDGEFYTDESIVPEDKRTDGKVDPSKLKLLERLVYKLNKIKKTMQGWTGEDDRFRGEKLSKNDWNECTEIYTKLLCCFYIIVTFFFNLNEDEDEDDVDRGYGYNKWYSQGGRPVLGKSNFRERHVEDFFNAVVLGGISANESEILGFNKIEQDILSGGEAFIDNTCIKESTNVRVTNDLIIPGVGKTAGDIANRKSLGRRGKLDELNNSPLCQQNWIGFYQITKDGNSKGWVVDTNGRKKEPAKVEDLVDPDSWLYEEEDDKGGFYWPGIAHNVIDACKMYYHLHFNNITNDWGDNWNKRTRKRAVDEMCIDKINNLILGIQKFFYEDVYQKTVDRYYDLKHKIKTDLIKKKEATAAAAAEKEKERIRLQRLSEKFADGKGLSPEGRELANNVTTLLTRGGLISTGVCTINEGVPVLSAWAEDCLAKAINQKPTNDAGNNWEHHDFATDEEDKKKNLFKSLIGLEIYCLWSFAFPDKPYFNNDWAYSYVQREMRGDGTLDDRLLSGTVAILKDYYNTDEQQQQLGMYLSKTKTEIQSEVLLGNVSGKKWIINNASQMEYVNNHLVHTSNTVCVIPSIADGMSQCYSYDSAGDESRYIYNMKYSLQNKDQNEYYEGIIKLANKKGSVVKYIGNVALSNHSGLDMSTEPTRVDTFFLNLRLNLNNATDLQANEVYKVMLTKLELIFKNYYDNSLAESGFSLEQLWGYMAEDRSPGSKFMEFAQIMMVKGMGDIFQEATATLKWGGQSDVKDKTFTDTEPPDIDFESPGVKDSIYKAWDDDGNMIRLGAMGDQPSGFRPAMINLLSNLNLWKKASEGDEVKKVNTKNLSGYITTVDEKSLMIEAVGTQGQGGGRKKNKTRKHRRSRSNKKVKKSGSRKRRRTKRNNH